MKQRLTRSVSLALSFVLALFLMAGSLSVPSLAVSNDSSDPYALNVDSEQLAITQQPADTTAEVGDNASFTVKASGNGLSYQWQYKTTTSSTWKNSGMTGSATATISIPATEARNGQKYRCVVSDGDGNRVTSNVVTLTVVHSGITITTQPEDCSVLNGETAQFSIEATGNNLAYQWQYYTETNGIWKNSGMPGSTTPTISIPATTARNGQLYRCIVKNSAGDKLISDEATMTVSDSIRIITQPSDTTAIIGETATFTVIAEGADLSYQWQFYSTNMGAWTVSNMNGSNTDTVRVPAKDYRDGHQYRCKITDGNGVSIFTEVAVLSVKANLIEITEQPSDITVSAGDTASFTIKATGKDLTYQWQYYTEANGKWKNSSMTGSTTDTVSIPATETRNGQKYRCIVKDKNKNSVTSDVAVLTVTSEPLVINVQPTNTSALEGDPATFTVKASGSDLTYQWQYYTEANGSWKNSSMTGSNSASITVPAVEKRNGQKYRCKITDRYGHVVLSDAGTLTVLSNADIELPFVPSSGE